MSDRIVSASWIATGVFAVSAIGAAITSSLRAPAFVVAVLLFVVGTALFIAALVLAADRSRREQIGMGGLFFLQGSAPREIQWHLLGALAVQTAAAFATAAARPYTSLAFGILVPMAGLGFAGLWGAKRGTFEARTAKR